MKTIERTLTIVAVVAASLFTQGCATNLRKAAAGPFPATVRFDEFKAVEMQHVTILAPFDESGANKKAAKKIDSLLFAQMPMVLPVLKEAQDSKPVVRTLRITPVIEEVKFIGGNARFWLGTLAGSSAVLMKVTYVDSATGNVVAEAEFYRAAGAWSGANSMGATDNMMLDNIVQDICGYSRLNR